MEQGAGTRGNGDRDELNEEEQDLFLLAKSYFDSHQLERCSALLESMNSDSTKVTFLRLYSRFLVSEEKKIGRTDCSPGLDVLEMDSFELISLSTLSSVS